MAKRLIIIGASSGLGSQIAMDMWRAGWEVAIAARREDRLKEISEASGGKIIYKTIDVAADDATERFYDLIEERGGMDLFIYAAGYGKTDPELNTQTITDTLKVNVLGFSRIVADAYKYYRATANRHPGRIAVITSIAATKGIGVWSAYSSSKRYQQTFINALEQLAFRQQVNVRFTDIRPGFVRTDLLDASKQYPMEMPVDYAARRIELAILRGKRVAVIDSRWAVVTALWKAIPQRLWRHINPDI